MQDKRKDRKAADNGLMDVFFSNAHLLCSGFFNYFHVTSMVLENHTGVP
jgi:hypothetical protein